MRVEKDGDEAVICVRDNGMGISAHMLHKVFDLFAQADHALDRHSGGLGIGLALVRRLVDLHGGRVSAQSEGLGHGTEMIVRLPIGRDSPSMLSGAEEPEEPAALAVRAGRILIVDDNRDAADSMALSLQLAGHTVCTAYDGQEGIELAFAFAPDVVLLDLGMPGLNGFEIARRIRQQPWGKALTLIAVTGWGQEQDRHRTRRSRLQCAPHQAGRCFGAPEGTGRRDPENSGPLNQRATLMCWSRPPRARLRAHSGCASGSGLGECGKMIALVRVEMEGDTWIQNTKILRTARRFSAAC